MKQRKSIPTCNYHKRAIAEQLVSNIQAGSTGKNCLYIAKRKAQPLLLQSY